MFTRKLRMVHGYRSINETDPQLRHTASAVHQRYKLNQIPGRQHTASSVNRVCRESPLHGRATDTDTCGSRNRSTATRRLQLRSRKPHLDGITDQSETDESHLAGVSRPTVREGSRHTSAVVVSENDASVASDVPHQGALSWKDVDCLDAVAELRQNVVDKVTNNLVWSSLSSVDYAAK